MIRRILLVAGLVALAGVAYAATGNSGTPMRRLATTTTGTASATVSVGTSATLVHAADAEHCVVFVQNTDADPIYCGQTDAVTSSNGIALALAAAVGGGGTHTFGTGSYGYGGTVYCIVGSGTADVRVQATDCP